ncbi:MAG: tetratricopeptide repeat protein [Rhodospirillales bacterium]|nr:tetratricopeptide repeat protein [Rhodospirillales bacterium]
MIRQIFLMVLLLAAIGTAYGVRTLSDHTTSDDTGQTMTDAARANLQLLHMEPRKTMAGEFLSSHFAQSENDWKSANEHLGQLLVFDPDNEELLKRSMILATGYGDLALAAQRAQQLVDRDPENALALMIVAVNAMTKDDMDTAVRDLKAMPIGDITDYIQPLLLHWAEAGQGTLNMDKFDATSIHAFHAALMALMLGDKEKARAAIDVILNAPSINPFEAERAADLLALSGDYEKAMDIYKQTALQNGQMDSVSKKIAALTKGPDALLKLLKPLKIENAAQGAALAMYDMADLLYRENSATSARLFAQLALALNPDLSDVHFMLANAAAHDGRYDEAIAHLEQIPPDHEQYVETQRAAADLMARAGRTDDAMKLLNRLFTENNDIESLIRIGDLYRSDEKYGDALTYYNRAADAIGPDIPEKYWHLLYARGMAYEREGAWDKAERDLKAALVYRPDHPFLLNYLGYGWADQGMHLEESLDLIKRAVALQPQDGYIADSLGWVYYMMGRYEEALPPLENAVELLPYDATLNDHLGDAYWQVGRRLEARFQWERARNFAENDEDRARIEEKLRTGLQPDVKQAKN